MSNMLEQAIIDAKALREVALKNAENLIVEKYSEEVKEAVQQLLEQEPGEEAGAPPAGEEELEVVADIPAAQDPDLEGDDELVVLDLGKLIDQAESDPDAEPVSMEADELADEVGIDLEDDTPAEAPANRRDDDEIEINDSDLVDLFQEMVVVDVEEKRMHAVEKMAEEEEAEEDVEVVVSSSRDDGMDKKDIEEAERLTARLETESLELKKENKKLKNILVQAKDRLEEVNLSNARLLYANRVLKDTSLNERQKNKIAEMVSKAQSVEEAKLIFETLHKTVAGTKRNNSPESLSEAVTRRSSVILSGRRSTTDTETSSPVLNRWATLAGLENKD